LTNIPLTVPFVNVPSRKRTESPVLKGFGFASGLFSRGGA
jgi:hypothetical protein